MPSSCCSGASGTACADDARARAKATAINLTIASLHAVGTRRGLASLHLARAASSTKAVIASEAQQIQPAKPFLNRLVACAPRDDGSVIASEAKQSSAAVPFLDRFVACAPRDDGAPAAPVRSRGSG